MIDLTPYDYTTDPNGWHMDDYHVDALYRLMLHVEPSTVAEIGSFKGRSTCAYVEAQKHGILPVVHLVDMAITDELRRLVRTSPRPDKFIFHSGSSDDFRMVVDVAVIDGAHDEAGAAKDMVWAVGWRTPWIVVHDVSGWPRNSGLKGSWRQGNELRRNPHYQVSWHDSSINNDRCWRGLMVAGPERFSI